MNDNKLKITIIKNENLIIGFKIEGHADYDVHGKDIVCSAVSVLAQTALESIFELTDISEENIDYEFKNGLGYVYIDKEFINEKISLLLKSFIIGIKGINNSYRDYLSVIEEEVD